MFRDISGTAGRCRTGNWTLDFVNVSSVTPAAAVPEPSALLLAGVGLALLLVGRCRQRRKATLLACGCVAALGSVPMHAQTSGPDFSNVDDFLQGQRTLLKITDLQVVAQTSAFNTTSIFPISTSNSGQSLQPTQNPTGSVDTSQPLHSFSAHMFNQSPAVTLTTMNNFNNSGTLWLQIQNVQSVVNSNNSNGVRQPTASGDNPTVLSGAVTDFTQDGYDDLALSFSDGRILVLTPNDINDIGKGPRRGLVHVDPLSVIAAGDFKGDGQREIAGLNIQSDGSLKLEIYTVDPSSLTPTLATSLPLTMPNGVNSSNPIALCVHGERTVY